MPNEPEMIHRSLRDRTASLPARIKSSPHAAILASMFLGSFVLHVVTAARTVTFSDSGDFLMAIGTVGNCHGPGYPLYLMAAKLFSGVVPLGSLAFRVSLMSGLFASLTICLMYWIVFRLTRSRIGGVVAGVAFAFSYTFWYETVIPETYAMSTFFLALIVVLLLRWERQVHQGRRRNANNTLALTAFVFGLAMTNLYTMIFILPAVAFFTIDTDWKQVLAPRNLLRMIAFFVLGLLPFIYQPVAAFRGPLYNYGDPSTLTRWIHHVTLYYQRGGLFGYPLPLYGGRIARLFGSLTTEFPLVFWLAAVGFIALIVKKKKYGIFFTVLFIFTTLAAISYSQLEAVLRAHFYYPIYFLIALFIGFGAAWIANAVRRWAASRDRLVSIAAVGLAALVLVGVTCVSIPQHYSVVDKSQYFYARDMAVKMLAKAAPDGILLGDTDNNIFPTKYMQFVEGVNPGVRVVNPIALTVPGWPGQDLNVTIPPPGVLLEASDSRAVSMAKRNAAYVPFVETGVTFDFSRWNVTWEGLVNRVYADSIKHAAGAPALVRQQHEPLSAVDSDARETIVMSDVMKAATLGYASDNKGAAQLYQRITEYAEKALYVPTLYGCETIKDAYELWGRLLNNMGQYKKTVRVMPGALLMNPNFASISYAYALARVGDLDAALAETKNFLLQYPDNSEALIGQGEVYILMGEYGKASASLKEAVSLSPDDTTAHFEYGVALLHTGDTKGAIKQFNLTIDKGPEADLARQARQMLDSIAHKSVPSTSPNRI